MAKKQRVTGTRVKVSEEVRRFLSDNGRKGASKGGQTTKRLIEMGKEAAGDNWREAVARRK